MKALGVIGSVLVALALASCGSSGGGTATQAARPATGAQLYVSDGCKSCHSLDGRPAVGPTFAKLAGSKVRLTGGRTVTADTAYLTRSIAQPNAQIVAGYQPNVMSNVIGHLPPAQVTALVAYIQHLPR